jgi:hypothetical protein
VLINSHQARRHKTRVVDCIAGRGRVDRQQSHRHQIQHRLEILEEVGLGSRAHEINFTAARLAREEADKLSTPDKPRFVAGSIGPTTKAISVTGGITFEALAQLRAAAEKDSSEEIRKVAAVALNHYRDEEIESVVSNHKDRLRDYRVMLDAVRAGQLDISRVLTDPFQQRRMNRQAFRPDFERVEMVLITSPGYLLASYSK